MKTIWKGSISFGLINIPVKIYTAVHESTLDLDMLDSRDHGVVLRQNRLPNIKIL